MKIIKLTKGKEALVDDELFDYLNQWKWYCDGRYAKREQGRKNRVRFYMHHMIIGCPINKMVTDHINGNKLDNRRDNLRICTESTNNRNRPVQANSKSGYKGIARVSSNKWRVRIWIGKKNPLWIGIFNTREEAIRAYNVEYNKLYAW